MRQTRTGPPKLGANFTKLFTASAVSSIGDGMYLAALPLLVVQFSDDPMALGLVVAAAELPWLVFSLHAGALVDRWDRKRVMVWTDAARFLVLAALSVLVVTDAVNTAVVVVAAFALGAGQIFFEVAAQSVIPDMVSRDQRSLSVANSRISAAQTNGEDFTGPPLGSALFGVWNVIPFVGNALSFAASSALIATMRGRTGPDTPPEPSGRSLWSEIGEGVRWLIGNRPLRVLALSSCLGNVVFAAKGAMLVLLAKDVLGLADFGFGLLLTAAAVGAFAGSFAASFLIERAGPGRVLLLGGITEGLCIVVMGLSRNAWVVGAMMVVTGGLMTVQNVVAGTLRQQIVPGPLFGRVLSSGRLIANAGAPVGAAAGAALAAAFSVQTPYLVGGALVVVVAILVYPALSNRALRQAIREAETVSSTVVTEEQ